MKVCVYSAIYGGYDQIKPIAKQSVECDFLMFIDEEIAHETQWQTRIAKMSLVHPRMNAKFFKVLPHHCSELLKYDVLIWIDGSAEITSGTFVEEVLSQLKGDLMVFKHPEDRDCIYQEAEYCKNMPKYIDSQIDTQVEHYREMGYPEHKGLYACGMMVYRLNNDLKLLLESWWDQISTWSYQDQISFPFALYLYDYKPDIFEYNLWDNPLIKFHQVHASDK
jgi:hypothetical protein